MNTLIKKELPAKRKFWLNDMEAIVIIMILLVIIGTINIFSASFVTAEMTFKNPYFFLTRHLISIVIGLAAFFIATNFDYHRLRAAVPFLMAFTLVALVVVLITGVSVNGAKRWIGIGSMQFQPSEIAKIVGIVMSASFLGAKIDADKIITPFNRTLLIVLIMAALVEVEPDMGTAVLVAGIPILMYVVAGMNVRWIGYCGIAVALVAAFMITIQPYRMERLKSWYDPWSQSQGVGYQTVQSLSAIGSGGLWGMGLGKGVSKYSYLPEAHTDFAFAVFSQENGLIAVLVVFVLYMTLAIYCANIARRAHDGFGKMMACGIMLLTVGQAAANMAMIIGLLPVVGVPLPFISYGGTSLILNMASIGVLINIGRYAAYKAAKEKNTIAGGMITIKTNQRLRRLK
ncbi:putative lipid II flippase FtsW [Pectinatus brassicae]|uniref:Probable peptidoglycan glycosyltransferase FtsW n=1 Tax=Pectinatus brassicae TaxID=862415 RepID=A0A840UH48_9FIRM|nr:putative lipid II flippase FtsW [Pectinatus brassicae]MBB5336446.1 cell division protein FtsW [Pectinatus brassicae]